MSKNTTQNEDSLIQAIADGNAQNNLDIANLYATKLNLTGGTMTGSIDMGTNQIVMNADPTIGNHLTRESFTNDRYVQYDNPWKSIDMKNTHTMYNLKDPVNAQEAATKNYVDISVQPTGNPILLKPGTIIQSYNILDSPGDWLRCDGSTYQLATLYPELYAHLGNTNTIPNMEAEFNSSQKVIAQQTGLALAIATPFNLNDGLTWQQIKNEYEYVNISINTVDHSNGQTYNTYVIVNGEELEIMKQQSKFVQFILPGDITTSGSFTVFPADTTVNDFVITALNRVAPPFYYYILARSQQSQPFTGTINLNADMNAQNHKIINLQAGTNPQDAINKQQLDDQNSALQLSLDAKLDKAGGIMTGSIYLQNADSGAIEFKHQNADQSIPGDPSVKLYSKSDNKLYIRGQDGTVRRLTTNDETGTVYNNLNDIPGPIADYQFNNRRITLLAPGVSAQDAVNKSQIDSLQSQINELIAPSQWFRTLWYYSPTLQNIDLNVYQAYLNQGSLTPQNFNVVILNSPAQDIQNVAANINIQTDPTNSIQLSTGIDYSISICGNGARYHVLYGNGSSWNYIIKDAQSAQATIRLTAAASDTLLKICMASVSEVFNSVCIKIQRINTNV